jgi:predicted component of type VI protein secretion system
LVSVCSQLHCAAYPDCGHAGLYCQPVTRVSIISCSNTTCLQEDIVIGSSPDCQLQVQGDNVGRHHARVFKRNGSIFCRAMLGNEEDSNAETFTWLVPDTPLLAGVDWMLSPGDQLAFGASKAIVATLEFDAPTSAPSSEDFMALERVLDAMVAGSSEEVKLALQSQEASMKVLPS